MIDYTGRIRYRKGFFGGFVVQVEYRYDYSPSAFNDPHDIEHRTDWRDADGEDLMNIGNMIPII